MEQEETTCRYCGVSYLILHEFQRLQERLSKVERELERERGSVERESREQLQCAEAQLDELRAANQLFKDSVKALTLQVSQADSMLVDLRTESKRMRVELENEREHSLHLRSVCERQCVLLCDAGPVLRCATAELHGVKHELSLLSRDWNINTTLILQHCSTAGTALKQEVASLQEEVQTSQHEVDRLQERKRKLQQQCAEQSTTILSLSRDLREKEVSLLSCQHQCESLQQQLLTWKRKEAETRRELEGALREGHKIRDEREALKRANKEDKQKMEDTFRKRLEIIEEQSSKWRRDAALELDIERQKNEQQTQNYRTEYQQLQDKLPTLVQSAIQELKEEVSALEVRLRECEEEVKCVREEATVREEQLAQEREEEVRCVREEAAVREERLTREHEEKVRCVREEAAVREERLTREHEEEVRCVREEAAVREERLTRELEEEVDTLQHRLQEHHKEELELQRAHKDIHQLRKETSDLHEENSLLQETVRRECEERAELTAALSLVREQLLAVRQAAVNTSVSAHSTVSSSLPSLSAAHSQEPSTRGRSTRGRSTWGRSTRGRIPTNSTNSHQLLPTLPRLTTERPTPFTETRHRNRKEKHLF